MIKVDCTLWEKLDEQGNANSEVSIEYDFSLNELNFFLDHVKKHGLIYQDFIYRLEASEQNQKFEITDDLVKPELCFVLHFIEYEAV